MQNEDLPNYTPKQQRLLEFLAAYMEIETPELERRIVAMELDGLEGLLGQYADAKEALAKPTGKLKLATVAEMPFGGFDGGGTSGAGD